VKRTPYSVGWDYSPAASRYRVAGMVFIRHLMFSLLVKIAPLKDHYCVQRAHHWTLCQLTPVHSSTPFAKFHLTLTYNIHLSSGLFSSAFATEVSILLFFPLLISILSLSYPSWFTSPIKLGGEYKLWTPWLCTLFSPAQNLLAFLHMAFWNSLYPDTLNLCSSRTLKV
jgi:hypothetical protein